MELGTLLAKVKIVTEWIYSNLDGSLHKYWVGPSRIKDYGPGKPDFKIIENLSFLPHPTIYLLNY